MSRPLGLLGTLLCSVIVAVLLPSTAQAVTGVLAVALPSGAVGSAYSYQFEVGGAPATECSATGSLPAGIAWDDAGCAFSGTPTAGGEFPLRVTAANGTAADAVFTGTLAVTEAPSLAEPAALQATVGVPYMHQLAVSGYPAPTVAVLNPDQIPPGLAIDPAGLITGTPRQIFSTFSMSVRLSNSAGERTYGLHFFVGGTKPVLTSGAPDAVTYGAGYSFQITATGIPAPRVGIDGDLPPGLLVDENTGELRGTTYQIGDYPITVTADNGWGRASADYTLHVTGTAPAILDSPPPAQVGVNYRFRFDTGDSNPRPSFTVVSGTLPANFLLFTDGTITGYTDTPTPGSPVTVRASSPAGPPVEVTFTLPVLAVATISGAPPAGAVGEPYSFTFTTSGRPTVTIESGTVPRGLELSPAGVLAGTPTRAGTYRFTVRAAYGSAVAAEAVTLQIQRPPTVTIADSAVTEGDAGTRGLDLVVTLSRPSTVPVTVHWATANGSARAGRDYVAAWGTVTFAPGETSRVITVRVRGDRVRERDEHLVVALARPWHATIARARAWGRIVNDD